MPNKIIQIVPASGWAFVHKNGPQEIKLDVAVWALYEDGTVIGMVGDTTSMDDEGRVELVPVPPITGIYEKQDD